MAGADEHRQRPDPADAVGAFNPTERDKGKDNHPGSSTWTRREQRSPVISCRR